MQRTLPSDLVARVELAEQEMQRGYMDGFEGKPIPTAEHSHSYIHGFLNGKSDKTGIPWAPAAKVRYRADLAITADVGIPPTYQFFSAAAGCGKLQ